jgi:threonine/homoserine/homoserine lactone efflux protein
MGAVVGEVLPLGVGVAVSPLPVVAVILLLLAPRAGAASTGFAVGWVLGIVAVSGVVLLLAAPADLGSPSDPSSGGAWVRLVLGVVLLLLAARQWRGSRASTDGAEASVLPRWMRALDEVTAGRAVGLGFVLAAVNPKNLALSVAAGVAIASGDLPGGQAVAALVVFTLLAASTVALPVVAYAVAGQRARPVLDSARDGLETHQAAITGVLLLVLGVVLVGKGLGGLLG